jgi:hypothetical protein
MVATNLPTLSATPPTGVPASAAETSAKLGTVHASGKNGSQSGSLNIASSGPQTEQAEAGGSFPSALLAALLGVLLALTMVIAPKLRRHPAATPAGAASAGTAFPVAVPPARAPTHASPAAEARASRTPQAPERAVDRPSKRGLTPMDPAIAPMAGDAYSTMAGDPDDADESAGPGAESD